MACTIVAYTIWHLGAKILVVVQKIKFNSKKDHL
jgi:hypothetical protein